MGDEGSVDDVYATWPSNNGEGSEEMHAEAIRLSKEGLKLCSNERELATYIKRGFDKMFHPTWHCIVGRNFGNMIGHEDGHCLFYFIGPGHKVSKPRQLRAPQHD